MGGRRRINQKIEITAENMEMVRITTLENGIHPITQRITFSNINVIVSVTAS